MTIELKKFGTILTSRPAGLEAFQAIRPSITQGENVQVDFDGVLAVTPSWVDEFFSHLIEHVGDRIELLPTDNASVLATFSVLAEAQQEPLASFAHRYVKNKNLVSV